MEENGLRSASDALMVRLRTGATYATELRGKLTESNVSVKQMAAQLSTLKTGSVLLRVEKGSSIG